MFYTDVHFEYAKRFIDRTYDQRREILKNPQISKLEKENIKTTTVAYCTGFIVALESFHILSNGSRQVLEGYILKKRDEP